MRRRKGFMTGKTYAIRGLHLIDGLSGNTGRVFLHGHIHVNFKDDAERTSIIDATRVVNTYGYHIIEI